MINWIETVALEEIPKLGSRVVKIGTVDFAVFRTADNQVFALRDVCPHKGGPLSQGIVHDTSVTCPLHNWKIDLSSGNALSPDMGCTNVFKTKIKNGKVLLSLENQSSEIVD